MVTDGMIVRLVVELGAAAGVVAAYARAVAEAEWVRVLLASNEFIYLD